MCTCGGGGLIVCKCIGTESWESVDFHLMGHEVAMFPPWGQDEERCSVTFRPDRFFGCGRSIDLPLERIVLPDMLCSFLKSLCFAGAPARLFDTSFQYMLSMHSAYFLYLQNLDSASALCDKLDLAF